MRGKIVNLCFGFLNILFGILIILYTIKVPQDKTLLTVQENYVVNYVQIGIYVVMFVVAFIDLIQSFQHKSDTTFNVGYTIGIFILSFLVIKNPIVAVFSILSGIIVLGKSLKENLIELNSTTAISISIVLMSASIILSFFSINYSSFGQRIKNKENKNELKYSSEYFKYITELDISDVYINVKKDEKFGYINQYGETVLDFDYDYASPFVKITSYGKSYYVALVCKDGSTNIILKNGRKVLSYRTESKDDNYGAKMEELEDVYFNILKQSEPMELEIENRKIEINKVDAYTSYDIDNTDNTDNSIVFDYDSKYDIVVTKSSMGRNDIYELVEKANPSIKITLDAANLDYDDNSLYLFSNGYIPYYEISKSVQGWFTNSGFKKQVSGRAQILDFFSDGRLILKDYKNGIIYFSSSTGNKLSEDYYDIYICGDGRYIVKDEDNYFKIIDDNYNQVFDKEYAVIDTRFINIGLYLVLNTTEDIKFNDYGYANLNWSLLDYDGNVIIDNIDYIYDLNYKIDKIKNIDEENYLLFTTELKKLNYEFVGSKFYNQKNK